MPCTDRLDGGIYHSYKEGQQPLLNAYDRPEQDRLDMLGHVHSFLPGDELHLHQPANAPTHPRPRYRHRHLGH